MTDINSKRLLSQRNKVFYHASVLIKRIHRMVVWLTDGREYTKEIRKDELPFLIKSHKTKLLKKLGASEMILQHNKITNLKIAISKINGLIIKPKQVFSFCRLVGLPTKRKGYKEGMELYLGAVKASIGGGLCQITNMLNWLVFHSDMEITETYPHSIDPFPDDGRVMPFGSGATVFYNYRDFQFTNFTDNTFQIILRVTDEYLEGELRCDTETGYYYEAFQKNHKFEKEGEHYFRSNEIWRNKIQSSDNKIISSELLRKNHARTNYVPEDIKLYT